MLHLKKAVFALACSVFALQAQAAHLITGSDKARVQVLVYGDLQCPFSSKFMELTDRFRADFGDKIGFSFAHFPLKFHPQAMPAAIAAYCAGEQGKAAAFILDASKNFNKLNESFYRDAAKQAGVTDFSAFDACLTSSGAKTAVERDLSEGEKLGVMGTPYIFIGKEKIDGVYPYEYFKKAIEKAL